MDNCRSQDSGICSDTLDNNKITGMDTCLTDTDDITSVSSSTSSINSSDTQTTVTTVRARDMDEVSSDRVNSVNSRNSPTNFTCSFPAGIFPNCDVYTLTYCLHSKQKETLLLFTRDKNGVLQVKEKVSIHDLCKKITFRIAVYTAIKLVSYTGLWRWISSRGQEKTHKTLKNTGELFTANYGKPCCVSSV